MGRSDAELLEGIRSDDQTAWDEFVARYTALVWQTARREVDREMASDVVQEVWVSVLNYRFTIRDPERISAWLATTTRREAIRMSKKQRRLVLDESIEGSADPRSVDHEERLVDADSLRVLQRAFPQLSESCRELLHALFSPAQRSYDEIAADLGRPIGSLGPQRARCLETLKKLFSLASADSDRGRADKREVHDAN